MTKGCYFSKIDLKDAYYSVSVKHEHKKLLKFEYKGNSFQITCLPNGYSQGPRKFTKLLKPALAYLRLRGHITAAYIDDLINVSDSYHGCVEATNDCVLLFDSLGFTVHPTKSVFIPTQCIEYLGFIIDSRSMRITLTTSKILSIKKLCEDILNHDLYTIRRVATLLGKFSSSFLGVKYGRLHYRQTEKEKIKHLRLRKGKYEAKMTLSSQAKKEI